MLGRALLLAAVVVLLTAAPARAQYVQPGVTQDRPAVPGAPVGLTACCYPPGTPVTFLLGGVPSLADCALYNPVWFLQARMGVGDTPSPLDRLPKIVEWSKRMKAFGSGKPAEMSSADALAVAKAATPEPGKVDEGDPSGLKAGQKISITPDDTGKVPVTGTLVGLTNARISIIRSDDQVGDVIVHFPRAGFMVQPA